VYFAEDRRCDLGQLLVCCHFVKAMFAGQRQVVAHRLAIHARGAGHPPLAIFGFGPA
jgi:hypothetical protein